MKPIELLAPARDCEAAMAAVDYGADAVYIGGARFGARRAAGNSIEQIARAAEYAHRYGVRVHATLNTLLLDSELQEAEQQARALIAAGIDALIVQDMALRRMALPVELHASTQVCNMTPEGARFLGEAGFARVILERALSLDEIRRICAATEAEVECFVHGAICVGYSGRCFLSRSMSARSGNRGDCSQPCRQTWDLTDGAGHRYLTGKHLLSVRDLNLSTRIGDLLDAGVSSLKIEGRLKDTDYIKNIVACYRRAVDEALRSRPHLRRASAGESLHDFTPDPAKSFTRGDSVWFLDGRRAGVASFDTPKAVGEPLGRVAEVRGDRFRTERPAPLTPGDGICLVSPSGTAGASVNAVEGCWIRPSRMEGIRVGATLCRNLDIRFQRLLAHSRTRRVIPAAARLTLSADCIRLCCTDAEGVSAEIVRPHASEPARDPAANAASLRAQVMRSGDTLFAVREAEIEGAEHFVPASVVAALRREVLEALLQKRLAVPLPHRILPENLEARYPADRLGAEANVTNRLSRAFYLDHGVREIAAPLELAADMEGACVLRSAYCLRRELGECLREHPALRGDLYLEHGPHRYRLDFDCRRCEMRLIRESSRPRTTPDVHSHPPCKHN